MRRKIALVMLSGVLLVGAIANVAVVANPSKRLTTYFRTHQYTFPNSSYDLIPDFETDVPTTAMSLVALNISVAFVAAVLCVGGGVFTNRKTTTPLIDKPGIMLSLKPTIDAINCAIVSGKGPAADETLQRLDKAGLLKRYEAGARHQEATENPEPGKTLAESQKVPQIKIADLVKEWAGTQNVSRTKLIDDLKARIGLPPEQAKAMGDAIYTRFNERLQAARKMEVINLLRYCGNLVLAKKASAIADTVFKAIYSGVTPDEAVWNAVVDSIS